MKLAVRRCGGKRPSGNIPPWRGRLAFNANTLGEGLGYLRTPHANPLAPTSPRKGEGVVPLGSAVRHCERSEAIQAVIAVWIASSLSLLAMTRTRCLSRRIRRASALRLPLRCAARPGAATPLPPGLLRVASAGFAGRPAFPGHRDGHAACPCRVAGRSRW